MLHDAKVGSLGPDVFAFNQEAVVQRLLDGKGPGLRIRQSKVRVDRKRVQDILAGMIVNPFWSVNRLEELIVGKIVGKGRLFPNWEAICE